MKSLKSGRNTSVSVEKIGRFGIWLLVNGKEYFLDYEHFPYFKDKPKKAIRNVVLLHSFHLHWPQLDVDLEIDILENKEKYPLIYRD